jgi:hypothetical protein
VIPDDESDLLRALANGRLQEGQSLDFKASLPAGTKGNHSIAVDLASFAVEGGTLLVGVAEGHPSTASPVQLAGLRERLENIARDAIDPPLRCSIREILSRHVAGAGYLVVEIAPSPDAPHSVEGVFRGRMGSKNISLKADEVRRLHQRRPDADATGTGPPQPTPLLQGPSPSIHRPHGLEGVGRDYVRCACGWTGTAIDFDRHRTGDPVPSTGVDPDAPPTLDRGALRSILGEASARLTANARIDPRDIEAEDRSETLRLWMDDWEARVEAALAVDPSALAHFKRDVDLSGLHYVVRPARRLAIKLERLKAIVG